tara:strand:+ start:4481 stop:5185 length:705 start_codon:yes stop_codon:yes gene_type:complete
METWWFLILEFAVAICLLVLSPRQPFPGPSKRFGNILITLALLLAIGQTAPRPTSVNVHIAILMIFGSFGLVKGVRNMLVTREEVIVAPFAGVLFCVGVTAFMSNQWPELTTSEEIIAFVTIVAIGLGQVWLVFRGLLIGRLPLAWSKAGLFALQKGQISTDRGSIACFEKAWDLEEEHLNPMAWIALSKIHTFLGNTEDANHWEKRLRETGGEDAVAPEWIEAIDEALSDLSD